jgi:hypothetical protein
VLAAREALVNRGGMPLAPRFGRLPIPLLLLVVAFGCRLHAQVTETPQTIEPGKFLLKVDALSLGLNPDSSASNQVRALGVGWALISAGITKDIDFELGTQLFVQDTYLKDNTNQTQSGIGEFTLRSKWTFWRDAASDESAALIPYVNLPNHSQVGGNGHTEGGLILPWATQISPGVTAGAMAEWDELRNVANTRYDTRLYTSAVIQAEVLGKLGAYAEATLATSTAGSASTWGSLNAGATLAASGNFQWDFEVGRVLGPSARSWVQTLRFRWKL